VGITIAFAAKVAEHALSFFLGGEYECLIDIQEERALVKALSSPEI
jgi:hypothetical protein